MLKKTLMSGNEAMAEGAIKAGCQFYAGYPITPQNELIAYMAKRMPIEGRVFIQAESELAAVNMIFGASLTGARSMTSSSSPGMSLKQEGISYLAGCELPAVIINVMRGGPGLGNIASSQSDYFQATRGGGHGDYRTIVLSPWSVNESAQLVSLAFDLADYYRNPVLILTEAIIAQMMEPVRISLKSTFRKKLLPKDWQLDGAKNREPRIIRSLLLGERALEKHNEHLRKKWYKINRSEQRFDTYNVEDAQYLIIAYGSQARIAQEAADILRKEGIRAGLFRPISLWPYPKNGLRKIGKDIKKIIVVEQSLGQMIDDVKLSLPEKDIHFLGKAGGGVPSASEIVHFIKKKIF